MKKEKVRFSGTVVAEDKAFFKSEAQHQEERDRRTGGADKVIRQPLLSDLDWAELSRVQGWLAADRGEGLRSMSHASSCHQVRFALTDG